VAYLTASMLYNLVECPHRVTLDLFGDPARRDPENPFIELLWERGTRFEEEVVSGLHLPFENLRPLCPEERERETAEALKKGAGLIYGGRIRAGNLLGEPDLIRRTPGGGYLAGDIKSGSAETAHGESDEGRPKLPYALQLSLYTDILERLGVAGPRLPFIWDARGREVAYDLGRPLGPRRRETLWEAYRKALQTLAAIAGRETPTLPARSSACKLCHWESLCLGELEARGDLTLIPELGRSLRDALRPRIGSIRELAAAPLPQLIRGEKTGFPGIGAGRLRVFHRRARLLARPGGAPFLLAPLRLPEGGREVFLDIETDPMRDLCYLHGFIERPSGGGGASRYFPCFAGEPTSEAEEKAFADALAYLRDRDCVLYTYSAYERTWWRKLRDRYPHLAEAAEIEAAFGKSRAVDLYTDVVKKLTEWPTRDHSIKTLAKFLGFRWRDPHPSGAASIEWYHRWVEERDPALRQRILDYNEDDCAAMAVLLDAVCRLPVNPEGP